ncbi:MAG: tetratricopeptide repeat protein [Gammaproteobacteria bacterium]
MPDSLPVFLAVAVIASLAAAALVSWPLLRRGGAPVLAVMVALAVPCGALFLYLAGSNYNWQPATSAAPLAASNSLAPELADALASLEARLAEQPDDVSGWLLLGNTYLQLQRPADAQNAFARARQLAPEDVQAKLGLAEAMTLQNRDALGGAAGELIEEVLVIEPDSPRALWYGGLAALARGDRQSVKSRWERLLTLNPPEPVRKVVSEQLVQLGFAAAPPAMSAPTPVGQGTAIEVRVSVSEAMSEQMAPNALLFLVARDGAGAGGPPVAALREQASGLPRVLRISDANAMLPGRTLSQLSRIKLIARVSNGGDALAQPGDVFGEALWVPGDGAVNIVMDQVVQP